MNSNKVEQDPELGPNEQNAHFESMRSLIEQEETKMHESHLNLNS